MFFNAQHAPIGAFASFTLGHKGRSGGLGLELGKPADQNIYIGLERNGGAGFDCLPFFLPSEDEAARFDLGHTPPKGSCALIPFPDAAIRREYLPGRDSWQAGDLKFTIFSPVMPAPEPGKNLPACHLAYVPALAVELEIDNRK